MEEEWACDEVEGAVRSLVVSRCSTFLASRRAEAVQPWGHRIQTFENKGELNGDGEVG
jgi:hypothetical protein